MDSFSEIFGSLFTWNEPVARLRYFLNHIFIFLFLVPLICLLVFVPEKSIFLKLVCLLIVVLDVYLLLKFCPISDFSSYALGAGFLLSKYK